MPSLSYFMFVYVTDDLDQFTYLANICLVLGAITSILFLASINEPKLIAESKEVWNRHLPGFEDNALGDLSDGDGLCTDESLDKIEIKQDRFQPP